MGKVFLRTKDKVVKTSFKLKNVHAIFIFFFKQRILTISWKIGFMFFSKWLLVWRYETVDNYLCLVIPFSIELTLIFKSLLQSVSLHYWHFFFFFFLVNVHVTNVAIYTFLLFRCYNGYDHKNKEISTTCKCTRADYEWCVSIYWNFENVATLFLSTHMNTHCYFVKH